MLHIDFFVFVDADVDPLDPRTVLTAIALEADPDADFHQFGVERMPKVPLNIYQTPDEKGSADVGTSKTKTAKAYIDATSDRPAGSVAETKNCGGEHRNSSSMRASRRRRSISSNGEVIGRDDPVRTVPARTGERR